MLFSTSTLAYTGHSHAQNDTLGGILRSLTTHPLLFGLVAWLTLREFTCRVISAFTQEFAFLGRVVKGAIAPVGRTAPCAFPGTLKGTILHHRE